MNGTLDALPDDVRYDAILYVDVLEHIEDDAAELRKAQRLLAPHGAILVLAAAHPFLYTPFDRALGHWRRYTRSSLRTIVPPELRVSVLRYLHSAGGLASLANRLLRQAHPTPSQIAVLDRALVPASRVLDPLLGHRVGTSVLGVLAAR